MSISKIEIKKFAKLIAEKFLENKSPIELQSMTQDYIDTFIIPIVTEVEDVANNLIAEKVVSAFEEKKLEEDEDWWRNRR